MPETERLACDQADLFLLEAHSADCDSCLGEALQQLPSLPSRQWKGDVRAISCRLNCWWRIDFTIQVVCVTGIRLELTVSCVNRILRNVDVRVARRGGKGRVNIAATFLYPAAGGAGVRVRINV
jgi:hypothetical protein